MKSDVHSPLWYCTNRYGVTEEKEMAQVKSVNPQVQTFNPVNPLVQICVFNKLFTIL